MKGFCILYILTLVLIEKEVGTVCFILGNYVPNKKLEE